MLATRSELPGPASPQPRRTTALKVGPRDSRSVGVVALGSARQPAVVVAKRRMKGAVGAVAVAKLRMKGVVAVAKRRMVVAAVARQPVEVVAAVARQRAEAAAAEEAVAVGAAWRGSARVREPACAVGAASNLRRSNNAVRWRPGGRHTSRVDRVLSWQILPVG
jgi:hypothetical protein